MCFHVYCIVIFVAYVFFLKCDNYLMILDLEHVTTIVMKHVRFHEAEDRPCGTF